MRNLIKKLLLLAGYRAIRCGRNGIAGIYLEEDLAKLVKEREPVCFDVGANVGQTIELFYRIFQAPRIYAFEPSAASFAKLSSAWVGRGVSLYNLALGDCRNEKTLYNHERSYLNSFLPVHHNKLNSIQNTRVIGEEVVQCITLDEFIEQEKIDTIDLLKVDTQGFDLNVLKGARNSLSQGRIKNILVEVNFVRMYGGEGRPGEIFDFLSDHNIFLVDIYDKARPNGFIHWGNALFKYVRE